MLKSLFIILSFIPFASCIFAEKNPEELGKVQWNRTLEEAQKMAIRDKKPIFILFQEIPGCGTCKNYGTEVLSHPLIAEAIETFFIPLAIHNNKNGSDKKTLDYFEEPSWNNPVVRIVKPDLSPLVTRLSGNYTAFGLVSKINAALLKNGQKIPEYLKLLEEELLARAVGTEKATLGMYCFWSGEKNYAQLDGVIGTRAGYVKGSEVVEVEYNPNKISLEQLVSFGAKSKNADKIYMVNENVSGSKKINIPHVKLDNFRVDPESKYYLYKTTYKYVPMSSLQATKINSLLSENINPDFLLSPNQKKILEQVKTKSLKKMQNLIGLDIYTAYQISEIQLSK
ncbi:MAG: peptide-methionine (S)-S-oxide reductase [Saprospiraceae bacterium]|nr:peptide-methionine (S)-S-oxide reductase [Candidatus Vicinibacter affinis]